MCFFGKSCSSLEKLVFGQIIWQTSLIVLKIEYINFKIFMLFSFSLEILQFIYVILFKIGRLLICLTFSQLLVILVGLFSISYYNLRGVCWWECLIYLSRSKNWRTRGSTTFGLNCASYTIHLKQRNNLLIYKGK